MLTDILCKTAKTQDKPYKLSDKKGVFLLINPNGSKYFRMKYRFSGKEKTLALGVYPETTLKEARDRRDEARKQIATGIDPGENRKAVKQSKAESATNSFAIIARESGQKKVNDWEDKNNRSKRMLERNIFPWLGNKPITDILPKDILVCLRRVEDRGKIETAHRITDLWSSISLCRCHRSDRSRHNLGCRNKSLCPSYFTPDFWLAILLEKAELLLNE